MYLLSCLGNSVYGIEFIFYALGPLFQAFSQHFLLKSCIIHPSQVLCLMGCLLLSANKPVNNIQIKETVSTFPVPINLFKTLPPTTYFISDC